MSWIILLLHSIWLFVLVLKCRDSFYRTRSCILGAFLPKNWKLRTICYVAVVVWHSVFKIFFFIIIFLIDVHGVFLWLVARLFLEVLWPIAAVLISINILFNYYFVLINLSTSLRYQPYGNTLIKVGSGDHVQTSPLEVRVLSMISNVGNSWWYFFFFYDHSVFIFLLHDKLDTF